MIFRSLPKLVIKVQSLTKFQLPGVISLQHNVQNDKQFSHRCNKSYDFFLAALDQPLIVRSNFRVVSDGLNIPAQGCLFDRQKTPPLTRAIGTIEKIILMLLF